LRYPVRHGADGEAGTRAPLSSDSRAGRAALSERSGGVRALRAATGPPPRRRSGVPAGDVRWPRAPRRSGGGRGAPRTTPPRARGRPGRRALPGRSAVRAAGPAQRWNAH